MDGLTVDKEQVLKGGISPRVIETICALTEEIVTDTGCASSTEGAEDIPYNEETRKALDFS